MGNNKLYNSMMQPRGPQGVKIMYNSKKPYIPFLSSQIWSIYQFSQTLAGTTSLIILQWVIAFRSWNFLKRAISFFLRTCRPPFSIPWKTAGLISCFGIRYVSRDLLPRKSGGTASLNRSGVAEDFLQKMTMLIKLSDESAFSRKILQVGKTYWIVLTISRADGSVMSPA